MTLNYLAMELVTTKEPLQQQTKLKIRRGSSDPKLSHTIGKGGDWRSIQQDGLRGAEFVTRDSLGHMTLLIESSLPNGNTALITELIEASEAIF